MAPCDPPADGSGRLPGVGAALHLRRAPVIGTDAHLPPVPAAALHLDALRRRFAEPPAWQPEIGPEIRAEPRPPMPAAVLIGIVTRQVPAVLLTRRSDRLRHHPGQVCFPGGRIEPDDAGVAAAALREAREEIGLAASFVEPLGELPAYVTHSGFAVTSLVALIDPCAQFVAHPDEVAEVFEVPLPYLMSPANHRRHELVVAGTRRQFHSMIWPSAEAGSWLGPEAEGGHTVWGASAAMLRNLYWFLSA